MSKSTDQIDTAIFDMDGTLVDSNYQHALAWYRAFRRFDITLPIWQLHRAIGMGGDQLVIHVAGDQVEKDHGDEVRDAHDEEFEPLIGEVAAFEGATELLKAVKERGFKVVLASSGQKKDIERFLSLIDGEKYADTWTTSDDAERSKPHPDIVQVALERVGSKRGIMVGDSTWDCIAAAKLDLPTIAVQTGGFSVEELTEAGAVAVFDSLTGLLDKLADTALRGPHSD